MNVESASRWRRLAALLESSGKTQNLVAGVFILAVALIGALSVWRGYSMTTDEDKHYLYGEMILAGDATRFNPSTMPVTALNALPKKVSSLLPEGRWQDLLEQYSLARMVTIFFSCLVAFLVFYWARLLYGFIPALFSLVLYVLDPNIMAHSQLVTTDLYTTGSLVFAFFSLWKFANERSLRNGLLCVLALGLSQLAKYTSIVLFPLFLITLLVFDLTVRNRTLQAKEKFKALLLRYTKYSIVAVVVSILIINLGFLFHGVFTAFGEYQFRSSLLQKVQSRFPVLHSLPVPVAYPYLAGLDYMANVEQSGSALGNNYLLGQVRKGMGFAGYYVIASALKEPIATQLIFLAAVLAYMVRKNSWKEIPTNELFLLVPALFFTIYFNFLFKTQAGIRYYLPVFPFVYIFSGSLFTLWKEFSIAQKTLSLAMIAYLTVSVFSYHPYYLSYLNEIIWDRNQAYKYLADSNLDWGQGRQELDRYLFEHPDAVYRPGKVRSGHVVVRVNDLVGVTQDPEKFAWLRDNFEPVDVIAHSYLVYQLSSEDIDRLCSTTINCNE